MHKVTTEVMAINMKMRVSEGMRCDMSADERLESLALESALIFEVSSIHL